MAEKNTQTDPLLNICSTCKNFQASAKTTIPGATPSPQINQIMSRGFLFSSSQTQDHQITNSISPEKISNLYQHQ
jgi:hypothetical protein